MNHERSDAKGFGSSSWSGGTEWDSGSGVTEQWGVGNTFGGVEDPPSNTAGRAPRGLRRAEDQMHGQVSDALSADHTIDESQIVVHVHDGEVTLTGTVGSREQKRRAGDLAARVVGVRAVINDLRVP